VLLLIFISVQEWVIIATFVLNAYVIAVQPLVRKPIVVAAKSTAHAAEKAGKVVTHPIVKAVRKIT
jgi:hypothetical protein